MLRLVDAAVFNVLVGNADAHSKNYSLLHADGGIDFAPLYDLLCTAAYPGIHAKLAMKVGKRSRLGDFTPDTWDDFAREIGVGAPFVRRRAAALAALSLERLDETADRLADEGFGGENLRRFADVIAERAKTLVALSQGQRKARRVPPPEAQARQPRRHAWSAARDLTRCSGSTWPLRTGLDRARRSAEKNVDLGGRLFGRRPTSLVRPCLR